MARLFLIKAVRIQASSIPEKWMKYPCELLLFPASTLGKKISWSVKIWGTYLSRVGAELKNWFYSSLNQDTNRRRNNVEMSNVVLKLVETGVWIKIKCSRWAEIFATSSSLFLIEIHMQPCHFYFPTCHHCFFFHAGEARIQIRALIC